MTLRVLDPTSETHVVEPELAPRLNSLSMKTVGFISNGKEGTDGFFSHLDRLLKERFQIAEVVWTTKSNYSAPAESDIIDKAKEWDLAITGLGD